jgi:potassium-dependent mechanosensitive channel
LNKVPFNRRCHTPAWLIIAGLLFFIGLSSAHAQTPEEVEAHKLDQIASTLQNIDAALQDHGLSDQALQNLRDQISPSAPQIDTIIEHIAPRLAAVKARLEQLGAPPDPKAPPEDSQITSERAEQQKIHDTIDALMKHAKLLGVRIDQTVTQISSRRRALFTHTLFERSPSLASPGLWYSIARELPHDVTLARNLIGDCVATFRGKLPGWRLPAFVGLLALIIFLYWPLARMARWVLAREPNITEPNRLYKILAAWWVAFVIASLPIAALFAIGWLFQAFELLDPRLQALTRTLFEATALIALTAGIGRGLLSPEHTHWRLVAISDDASRNLLKLALTIAVLVAITRVSETFVETIGASSTIQTAIRGTGAAVMALVIVTSLWRFRTKEDESEDLFGPRVAPSTTWWSGPLRVLLWAAAISMIICVLTGFLVLSEFIAHQIVWVTGVLTITVMSSSLIDAGIAASFRPSSSFGRTTAAIIGLSPQSLDQFSVLIGGAVRAIGFVVALLLVLAPWGIQSADIPGYFRAAFYGVKFYDFTISLSSICYAIGIFAAGCVITRTIVRWLDTTYLPRTSLDIGLRNAIKTSFGYVGICLSILFSLAYIGVSFERLAVVASALSIGIGFGLQSIVNNFVSGLILLWERALRVGDWIVVGADEGFVRRINVRSTEIETFDRAAVIIPNSNLVTGVVKNFVRTDRVGRIRMAVATEPSADPREVCKMLTDIATSHELVLEAPEPYATFSNFDTAHLNFEIFCFVADVTTMAAIKSDLNFEIFSKFKALGWLSGPPPSSIVTLAGLERFESLLQKAAAGAGNDGLGKSKQGG